MVYKCNRNILKTEFFYRNIREKNVRHWLSGICIFACHLYHGLRLFSFINIFIPEVSLLKKKSNEGIILLFL